MSARLRRLSIGAFFIVLLAGSTATAAASGQSEPLPDLRQRLLRATVTAIDLEIEGYQTRLEAAQAGTGPSENVERFKQRLATLAVEREKYLHMQPQEYPEPVRKQSDPSEVLDPSTQYGPILPPTLGEVTITVDAPCKDGSPLAVDGATRSGPFYHLAGIAGNDYGVLRKGRRYALTVCLVYRREYFGTIGDYYVYVTGVRQIGT